MNRVFLILFRRLPSAALLVSCGFILLTRVSHSGRNCGQQSLASAGLKYVGQYEPVITVRTVVPQNGEFLIRVHSPSLDSWLSVSLLNRGQVEEDILRIIEQRMAYILKTQKGDVHLLDIGANIGFITLFAASLSERVKVTAVEPTPWHHRLLTESMKLNPELASRVKLFRTGLSDSSGGSLCMQVEGDNGAATSATKGDCDHADGVRVDVTTLDELLQHSWSNLPSIIKIDVEGYESHVLRGSSRTLKRLLESQESRMIISEYVPFRTKRANPEKNAYKSFFDNFPVEKWDLSLVSPESHGLLENSDTKDTLQVIKEWSEVEHAGGNLIIQPKR